MICDTIVDAIGNTPLLRIDPRVHGLPHVELYAKLEYMNPFGSVKDRVARAMLRDALEDGLEGRTVVEASSGNTAKALAGIANAFGVPFLTISNRIKVPEVKDVLAIMGAQVRQLPGKSECPDPNDPDDPINVIARLLEREGEKYFYTDQYRNPRNTDAHAETTGVEIVRDLGRVDFLFGGLGTTGSTLGTFAPILAENPQAALVGIITAPGEFIPGIRNMEEMADVGLFRREAYASIVPASGADAVDGMLALARGSGVLAGPTAGSVYATLLRYLREIPARADGAPHRAVFIACDRAEWYLSYVRERRPELFSAPAKTDGVASAPIPEESEETSVRPEDLTAWRAGRDALVVDVRGSGAFRAGRIPGSVNMPYEILVELVETGSPFPPEKPLLFVCPVGIETRKLVAYLRAAGYDAFSLAGGLRGYRDAGGEFVRGNPAV